MFVLPGKLPGPLWAVVSLLLSVNTSASLLPGPGPDPLPGPGPDPCRALCWARKPSAPSPLGVNTRCSTPRGQQGATKARYDLVNHNFQQEAA